MNNLVVSLISAVIIGVGATLMFDLWALILKHAFKVPPSNMCLVGRWLRYAQEGIFIHANITSSPRKSVECTTGWIAHYVIGISFALAFVALAGSGWLQRPTFMPALIFGVVTVFAPLFIMQPLLGLGFAASKSPNPTQARIRSLMNHTVFGIGLYLFGLLVSWWTQVFT